MKTRSEASHQSTDDPPSPHLYGGRDVRGDLDRDRDRRLRPAGLGPGLQGLADRRPRRRRRRGAAKVSDARGAGGSRPQTATRRSAARADVKRTAADAARRRPERPRCRQRPRSPATTARQPTGDDPGQRHRNRRRRPRPATRRHPGRHRRHPQSPRPSSGATEQPTGQLRRLGSAFRRQRRRSGSVGASTSRQVTETVNGTVNGVDETVTGGALKRNRRHRSDRRRRQRRRRPRIDRRQGRRRNRRRRRRPARRRSLPPPALGAGIRRPVTVTMPVRWRSVNRRGRSRAATRSRASAVYPAGSRVNERGHLEVAGCDVVELAARARHARLHLRRGRHARPRPRLPRGLRAPRRRRRGRLRQQVLALHRRLPALRRGGALGRRRLRRRAAHGAARRLRPRSDPHARQQQVRRGDPLRRPRRHPPPDPRLLRRDRALRAAARGAASGS